MRLKDCERCRNWKSEALTYNELLVKWEESIGGIVTPGVILRYERITEAEGEVLDDVRIGFKYCSEGMLSRFYVRKGDNDRRPVREMRNCRKFSDAGQDFSNSSSIWHICTEETHGPSEHKGIRFVPGLYENHTYIRIPMYGPVRPRVVRTDAECSKCGKRSKRSLVVRVEKSFCCNKHYLEWWAKRYREEYERLGQLD